MSDRWLNKQHDEVRERNRREREAVMQEAQKQAAARAARRR